MFKSKHSGWTYDLKRTPFGGGGFDPFQGVGDVLASIDPGPAIGNGLAEVDTTVNRELPGGWALPAIVTAAVLAPEFAPELLTLTEGTEGALTTDAILGSSGFVPTAGSSFAIDPALAYTAGATSANAGSYLTPSLMGPTYGELGITGLEGGFAGPTYGELGYTGLNQAEAIAAADAAAKTGMSASEILDAAKKAKNLSDLLKQGAGSGLTNSLGQLAQGANPQGQALTSVVRGNQNPFTFTPQQPIQDTRQAQLASLLKQG
jgi:hypothetical protein